MVNENGHKRKLISVSLRHSVMKRDDFTCQLCGKRVTDGVKLEVDHILPVAEGGKNNPNNLRTLCFECNRGRVTDINRQTIMKLKTQDNPIKDRESVEREAEEILKELGFAGVIPEPQAMIFMKHRFWYQIKSIFIKPNPWKRVWVEELNEWCESRPIFYIPTWRELFERKIHYKWRRFKSTIYQFFFVIPDKRFLEEIR